MKFHSLTNSNRATCMLSSSGPALTPMRRHGDNRSERDRIPPLPHRGGHMSVARVHVVTLVACFLSVACGSETDPPLVRSQAVANAFANSEWSEPVNIGAPVN